VLDTSEAAVLIAEDERGISEVLGAYLGQMGYRIYLAESGLAALALFREHRPDVVLLDLGLPGLDGLEVLKRIRAESAVPVLILTARVEEIDQLLGLELGADDYVTKPFRVREVLARIRALLRRAQAYRAQEAALRVGPLELWPQQFTAQVDGQTLALTPTEFRLLCTLAKAAGRVFTRSELIEAALPGSEAMDAVINTHLMNLRRKLAMGGADHLLKTVRGVGYRLSAEGVSR
jgi:two-component system response regulator AdeR